MNETQFPAPSGSKKSTVLWIVVLVLVAVAVLGYYYYYSAYDAEIPYESTGSLDAGSEAAEDTALTTELEAVDLENLDAELGEIDKELAQ